MARTSNPDTKHRTTLTLRAASLKKAARIAHARNVTLSTVVGEVLDQGLETYTIAERGADIVKAYREMFAGFSEQEMAVLDGVIMEPQKRRRLPKK